MWRTCGRVDASRISRAGWLMAQGDGELIVDGTVDAPKNVGHPHGVLLGDGEADSLFEDLEELIQSKEEENEESLDQKESETDLMTFVFLEWFETAFPPVFDFLSLTNVFYETTFFFNLLLFCP